MNLVNIAEDFRTAAKEPSCDRAEKVRLFLQADAILAYINQPRATAILEQIAQRGRAEIVRKGRWFYAHDYRMTKPQSLFIRALWEHEAAATVGRSE